MLSEFVSFVLFAINVNSNKAVYGVLLFGNLSLIIVLIRAVILTLLNLRSIHKYDPEETPYTFDSLKNMFFKKYLDNLIMKNKTPERLESENITTETFG